nr:MAG TPA: hypothetical protein [Caudoviricetes sp.]
MLGGYIPLDCSQFFNLFSKFFSPAILSPPYIVRTLYHYCSI